MKHPTLIIREALQAFDVQADAIAEAIVDALTYEGLAVVDADTLLFYENEMYGARCFIATLTQKLEAAGFPDPLKEQL
jgi:hypothetical protein